VSQKNCATLHSLITSIHCSNQINQIKFIFSVAGTTTHNIKILLADFLNPFTVVVTKKLQQKSCHVDLHTMCRYTTLRNLKFKIQPFSVIAFTKPT